MYAIGIDRDDPRALRTRINPYSLRQITDDTGGYTEVVKESSELGPATGRIADELNKQYTLGYTPAHAADSIFTYRVRGKRAGHRCVPGADILRRPTANGVDYVLREDSLRN